MTEPHPSPTPAASLHASHEARRWCRYAGLALLAMALAIASFIITFGPARHHAWNGLGFAVGIVIGGVGIALAMLARRGRRVVPARCQRVISTVSILACFFAVPYIFALLLIYLHLVGGTSMGH